MQSDVYSYALAPGHDQHCSAGHYNLSDRICSKQLDVVLVVLVAQEAWSTGMIINIAGVTNSHMNSHINWGEPDASPAIAR